jgi:2-polyprenyl-3-methyl-5-hydroxy-6-metoxy-1,4-benzoquinol methylase
MIRNHFRLDTSHELYAQEMIKGINRFKKTGKILDIGCGAGIFLDYARKLGWDTYGIELTESNYRFAKYNLGLNVFQGKIEDFEFRGNYFDSITMLDALEHTEDPLKILKKVKYLLKDDGLLCLETPNASSVYHLFLGKRWISFSEVSHIYFFNKQALEKLLHNLGFKILHIETANINFFSKEGLRRFRIYPYFYDLVLILHKAYQILLKDFLRNDKSLKSDISKFTSKFRDSINFPTNFLFNQLMMGDQLRIYAKK